MGIFARSLQDEEAKKAEARSHLAREEREQIKLLQVVTIEVSVTVINTFKTTFIILTIISGSIEETRVEELKHFLCPNYPSHLRKGTACTSLTPGQNGTAGRHLCTVQRPFIEKRQ